MFTYCKRNKSASVDEKSRVLPYEYHASELNTVRGFGKGAHLCSSLNQPWVQNRGIPRSLMDLEDAIKGRDRSHQPLCNDEPDDLQFSTFRPPLMLPRGMPGAPPAPIIEVRGYGGSGGCDHVGRQGTTCDNSCQCGSRCQCKGAWRGMNSTGVPRIGPPGMATCVPSARISF